MNMKKLLVVGDAASVLFTTEQASACRTHFRCDCICDYACRGKPTRNGAFSTIAILTTSCGIMK